MTYLVDMKAVTKNSLKGRRDAEGNWTYDTKLTACELILNTQNHRLTAELTEVPLETIRDWKKQEWWPQLVEEVQKMRRAELNTRLSKIVDSALTKIEDRLEHGDFVLNNKTGEIIRKPVSLKDANAVAKDILGQQISMNRVESEVKVETDAKELLKNLANEFAKLNRKLKANNASDIAFIEKETIDAIPNQREA